MTSALITIETPDGPLDLSVPTQMTIANLLAMMAPSVIGAERDLRGWTLSEPGGVPLDSSQTLEEAGILDGVRLSLRPAGVDRPIDSLPVTPATRVSATAEASLTRVVGG